MTKPTYIHLQSTRSTNSYLGEMAAEAAHGTVVYTDIQTAGRGQRGNTWEAEPGKNATFSVLLRPAAVDPNRQFLLSEASALAVVHALDPHIDGACVKWPNDIYYKDLKICGMLIEHALSGGHISHTIAGIGLNVNQRVFLSDAPNPVSLVQITGRELPAEHFVRAVAEELLRLSDPLPGNARALHEEYLSRLYRNDGYHPYRAVADSPALPGGTVFEARIRDVASDGMLTLELRDGSCHRFAFKEVEYLIPRRQA